MRQLFTLCAFGLCVASAQRKIVFDFKFSQPEVLCCPMYKVRIRVSDPKILASSESSMGKRCSSARHVELILASLIMSPKPRAEANPSMTG